MKYIGKLIAAGVLAASLAACGGGAGSGGSPASGQAAPTATHREGSSPATTGKAVCKAMPRGEVSRIIGMTVYSVDNLNNGLAEPTICHYYTDTDKINNVYVQWMTEREALWPDQAAKVDNPAVPAGTTMERVSGAAFGGDEALRETNTYEGESSVAYWVLLKRRHIVIFVQEVNGLLDARLRALTRAAVGKL